MIAIYSIDHLARAMWADSEEAFRRECKTERNGTYRTVDWEEADPLDRADYIERAERVVRLCRTQAKTLVGST